MQLIILGCGRAGRLLARAAVEGGHSVTVVDKDATAFEGLGSWFTGRRVTGIGFDRSVLLAAGVEHADALAAVTGVDSVNILVCLVARDEFSVPHVVARLYDPRQADVYRRAGITTIAPVSWGVTRMTDLLWHAEWRVQLILGDGDVELVEAEIPHRLDGRFVDELNVPGEILVAAVTRAGSALVPFPGMALAAGDRVTCAVRSLSRDRLQRQLAR